MVRRRRRGGGERGEEERREEKEDVRKRKCHFECLIIKWMHAC